MVIASTISKQTKSTDLGGPFTGFSAKQTLLNEKDGHQTSTRTILRNAWNTSYATGTYNGLNRKIGPFRAVNNAGDFLSRENYKCGGPTPMSKCSIGWCGSKIYLGSQNDQCDRYCSNKMKISKGEAKSPNFNQTPFKRDLNPGF